MTSVPNEDDRSPSSRLTRSAASYGRAAFVHTVVAIVMLLIGSTLHEGSPDRESVSSAAAVPVPVEETIQMLMGIAALEGRGISREARMELLMLAAERAIADGVVSGETVRRIVALISSR